jgi:hypothetical protein
VDGIGDRQEVVDSTVQDVELFGEREVDSKDTGDEAGWY